jgi:hypothetical protein
VIHVQPGRGRSILHGLAKPADMSDKSAPSDSTNQDQTTMECADDDQ